MTELEARILRIERVLEIDPMHLPMGKSEEIKATNKSSGDSLMTAYRNAVDEAIEEEFNTNMREATK